MCPPGSIDSSVLPEPIRGQTPSEIADLKRIYFAFDSADLLGPAKDQLNQNAAWLASNPGVHVQIEGHCDERGTADYNYALGQRRADATRNYLISQGVDPGRLHTISYGAERPDDSGHDEMAWARNRRASFLVYSGAM
jgi:peptidoglycan-associated lipoprotein